MADERSIKVKMVQCANGHNVKLEMLAGTSEEFTTIQCPTCDIVMILVAGDIRGIVPMD